MCQNSVGTAKIEPAIACHIRKPSSIYHRPPLTRGPRAQLLLLRGTRPRAQFYLAVMTSGIELRGLFE
jgi:hypothetical protein